MQSEYLKEMIERDIKEKTEISRTLHKLKGVQLIVTIIGFFLICSFIFNTYYVNIAIDGIKKNRQTTIDNRAYGDSILKNQKTIIHLMDSIIKK